MLLNLKMNFLENLKRLAATSISLSLVVWLGSCGKNGCRDEDGNVTLEKPVEIVRLEDRIENLKTREQTESFLNEFPLFSEKYLQRSRLPHDSILVSEVFALSTSTLIDTMGMDCKREFADLGWLQNDLGGLFSHVKYYYPSFYVPPVYTLVSGYGVDMEVKDSVIVLGLEFFLSDSAHFIPRSNGVQLPSYILRRLKKRFIVPEIGMVVGDRYCEINPLDNSMIGEMLKWGRIYYFMEKTMPCLADTLLSGYSQEELKSVEENLKTIWAHYLDQNLFFSTDLFLIKKYCDERPNVVEIGEKCPGRVGRWLGWQIVRKWATEKKIPLTEVMKATDSRKLFNESGFKP